MLSPGPHKSLSPCGRTREITIFSHDACAITCFTQRKLQWPALPKAHFTMPESKETGKKAWSETASGSSHFVPVCFIGGQVKLPSLIKSWRQGGYLPNGCTPFHPSGTQELVRQAQTLPLPKIHLPAPEKFPFLRFLFLGSHGTWNIPLPDFMPASTHLNSSLSYLPLSPGILHSHYTASFCKVQTLWNLHFNQPLWIFPLIVHPPWWEICQKGLSVSQTALQTTSGLEGEVTIYMGSLGPRVIPRL